MQPLGDVEHQVPAVALGQPLDQPLGIADAVGAVAQFEQGGLDAFDRGRLVELRRFFLGVPFRQVVRSQVVG